ncbi:MAG: addiction module protein [Geobacteraceae bacterium]
MNRQEHLRLLGELNQLRKMLDRVPVADVIDRMSLAAHMQEVEAALNDSGIILINDAPSKSENLQLWADEAERRLADLHAGKAREYPASEVFQSIRAALA